MTVQKSFFPNLMARGPYLAAVGDRGMLLPLPLQQLHFNIMWCIHTVHIFLHLNEAIFSQLSGASPLVNVVVVSFKMLCKLAGESSWTV
jgi:hypothetical protein